MIIIANPIYDAVFRYMLEDKEVAKRFIGIIIDKKIVDIQLKPQEVAYYSEKLPIAVQRLDFVAEIIENNGEKSKVLIEIQKSNKTLHADILRFRGYLAEQYKTDDLPIITIYILGFELKDLDAPVTFVNREYRDLYYDKTIDKKCEFIEKLTHNTYIIQIPRLKLTIKKKLSELMNLFNQEYRVSKDRIGSKMLQLPFVSKDKDIQRIVKRLEKAGGDSQLREKLDNEEMADMMYEEMFGDMDRKILLLEKMSEEKAKELQEKTAELQEKTAELQEKTAELQEKSAELQEKSAELQEKEKELEQAKLRAEQEKANLIKIMLEKGLRLSDIMETLNVDDNFLKKYNLID